MTGLHAGDFVGPAALATWTLLQLLSVTGVLAFLRAMPRDAQTETAEGVVAIVAARGAVSEEFVQALLGQSVAMRVIFAVEAIADPAHAVLARAAARHPDRCMLVVAGLATDEGQKIHNQRAALAALRPEDRVLVFLDADMLPPAQLVGRLLFPLVRGKAMVSSGYRWLVPAPGAPVSWVAAAINLQVATLPRLPRWTLAWGGAMALSRGSFDRLRVADAWRGALSDDLRFHAAAREAGVTVRAMNDLLLPSPAPRRAADLWRFGLRQYRHLVWNVPLVWGRAAAILALQSAGWAWALAGTHALAVAIGYLAGLTRGLARVAVARRLATPLGHRDALLSIACDLALPFAVTWLHLAMILAAPLSRRIRWAGVDYWMKHGKVARLRRWTGAI